MNVLVKLAGFGIALAGVFSVAFLTGTQSQALLAPVETHGSEFGALSNTVDGYTLRAERPILNPGTEVSVPFMITGPSGKALPIIDEDDPKSDPHLHLIAFRRDFSGFQHVYPQQQTDASWSAMLDLSPGPWHVIIELQPPALHGRVISLATDFTVAGPYAPEPTPPVTDASDAQGLTVRRTGTLTSSTNAITGARITDHGTPVTDLQLAHDSVAHAVIIRPADLGYLHLHATTTSTGPTVEFAGGVPSKGRYAMFVAFSRDDVEHVAAFTVEVTR